MKPEEPKTIEAQEKDDAEQTARIREYEERLQPGGHMNPENTIEILKRIQQGNSEYNLAIREALEALERQIPKMPVEGYIFREGFRSFLAKKDPDMANRKGSCCPNCGVYVGESEQTLKKKNYHPFCKWCGQALKQPEGEA